MPRREPTIAQHRLNIKPDTKLVKQRQQKFIPKMQQAIEADAKKLKACKFICQEKHPN